MMAKTHYSSLGNCIFKAVWDRWWCFDKADVG